MQADMVAEFDRQRGAMDASAVRPTRSSVRGRHGLGSDSLSASVPIMLENAAREATNEAEGISRRKPLDH
jgi:hypothetical protein